MTLKAIRRAMTLKLVSPQTSPLNRWLVPQYLPNNTVWEASRHIKLNKSAWNHRSRGTTPERAGGAAVDRWSRQDGAGFWVTQSWWLETLQLQRWSYALFVPLLPAVGLRDGSGPPCGTPCGPERRAAVEADVGGGEKTGPREGVR